MLMLSDFFDATAMATTCRQHFDALLGNNMMGVSRRIRVYRKKKIKIKQNELCEERYYSLVTNVKFIL